MRDAIRERILTIVTELKDVYEPHAATADSLKPYAVILQGEETEESDWVGFRQIVEIWPYVSRSSFVTVDELTKAIIAALEKEILQTVDGHVFSCMYLGLGSDQVDEEWDAITRGLRFAVVALQAVNIPETVADDPWMEALADWTAALFTDVWHVYRGRWPLGYLRPSILWRLSGHDVSGVSFATFEIRKRFVGHVLGRTPNEQTGAVLQIVEQLQTAIKLPLNVVERRFMTVVDPRADLQAGAINDGQITLTLTRKTNRPTEDVPFMAGVQQNGKLE